MKKLVFIFILFLGVNNINSQNKTYWKKDFSKGTFYLSVVKSDPNFGSHIRQYISFASEPASLIPIKYSNGKYKLKKNSGWSYKSYIVIKNNKLYYTTPQNGTWTFTRIQRSDIPRRITHSTRYPRKSVIE